MTRATGVALRLFIASGSAVAIGIFALKVLKFSPPWATAISLLMVGALFETAYWSRKKSN
jgi:hypothetical protein